jgi:hypothetical protein
MIRNGCRQIITPPVLLTGYLLAVYFNDGRIEKIIMSTYPAGMSETGIGHGIWQYPDMPLAGMVTFIAQSPQQMRNGM